VHDIRQKHKDAANHYEFNLKEHSSYIREEMKETQIYLKHKPVQVGIGWALDIKGPGVDVVDGQENSHINVLKEESEGTYKLDFIP
jgi:hypothetical protein